MKLLRETVRKLILENQQHYEKIADMIMTGDLHNVNQALELALTMGYVTDLQYDTDLTSVQITHPSTSLPWKAHRYVEHVWRMNVDPEFEAVIERKYDWRIKPANPLYIFFGGIVRKCGEIKIELQTPPDEQ